MFSRLVMEPAIAKILSELFVEVGADVRSGAQEEASCFLNRNAQPLVVLYGVSVAGALEELGLAPDIVCGYSVGELTAQVVAGTLSSRSALNLAKARAAAMDAVAPADFGMLAVRGPRIELIESRAAAACVAVAIRNGPDHAILAGPKQALGDLGAAFETDFGAHVVRLPIGVPAHSPWLAPAVGPFRQLVSDAQWNRPRARLLSALNGEPVYGRDEAVEVLARGLAEPVEWGRTIELSIEMGATAFFELGPGSGLVRMVREQYPDLHARSFDEFATLEGTATWLTRHGRA